jgi:hypothetical protein
MDSSEFIILLFNRMREIIAPHDVAIFFQDKVLPGVMGQVEKKPRDDNISLTLTHRGLRNRLIEAKIRELYRLEDGDMIRVTPGEIHDNLIKYEVYREIGAGNLQAVHRDEKQQVAGRRRSTGKIKRKRRSTRRLKRSTS